MTEDERRTLRENFTPSWLLDAVKDVDTLRDYFNDRDGSRPPEIRETLLRCKRRLWAVLQRNRECVTSVQKAGNAA